MKVVNNERARLVEVIAHAEREAAHWEQAAGLLAAQAQTHTREEASGRYALARAEAHLTAARDDAVRPLLTQAAADGRAYLDARSQQDAACDEARSTSRLGRRAAQRRLDATQAEARDARGTALGRWDSVPATGRCAATTRDGLEAWAARVAHQRADAEPLVAKAHQHVEQAAEALKQIRWRHRAETEDLTLRVYGRRDAASYRGVSGTNSADGRAQRWRRYADASSADLARIESLPIGRAVQFIETRRSQALQFEVEQAAAARRTKLGVSREPRIEQTDPELGLGI